jgi:hypothetical protein
MKVYWKIYWNNVELEVLSMVSGSRYQGCPEGPKNGLNNDIATKTGAKACAGRLGDGTFTGSMTFYGRCDHA